MNIDVFISHHTNSSLHIVEGIVNKLEANGIKCWYAPRDTENDYAGSITRAIKQCRVFVLVLNKDASESPHVLNELDIVTKRLSKKEMVDIIPFHTADTDDDISDEANYYVGRMHWIDAVTPPIEQRITELVSRITTVLEKETVLKVSSNIGEKYYLINSRIYADNGFIGRTSELSNIHNLLTSEKNKVFLVGMGGIGKSEIAKMYCQRYSGQYDNIIWLPYSTSLQDIIIDDNAFPIYGICRKDYLEDTNKEYFARKINILKMIANEKTLIVIDNFNVDDDPDLGTFCSGEYAVLFTTRYRRRNSNLNELTVGTMSDEEQFKLFTESYKRILIKSDISIVKKILNLLDSHPLTIRLVASIMFSRRIKPKAMLEVIENKDHTGQASDLIHNRLNKIFLISGLNDDEMYLMKNLSLVSLQGINVERLYSWCGLQDYNIIDRLIQRNWVIHNPATDTVHLHPIISDLVSEKLSEDLDSCDKFLKSFAFQCSNAYGTTFFYKQWLFTLAEHIYNKLPAQHHMSEEILVARIRMIQHMSFYNETIKLCESTLPKLKQVINQLTVYRILAHTYCLNGEPQKGVDVAKDALEKYETLDCDRMSDEERFIYKGLLFRLIEGNRALKKYDLAVEYAYKALEICKNYFRIDHFNSLVWADYHLARTLFMRNSTGDLEESEMLFKEAINLCVERSDTWSINFCKEYLAQIYMIRGQYDAALKETLAAYNSHVKQYGNQHTDVAINLQLQANIYRSMKYDENAAVCYRESIQILDKLNSNLLKEQVKRISDSGTIGYVN